MTGTTSQADPGGGVLPPPRSNRMRNMTVFVIGLVGTLGVLFLSLLLAGESPYNRPVKVKETSRYFIITSTIEYGEEGCSQDGYDCGYCGV